MDLNGLREAIRKQPFEPFAIRLADGRSLSVKHPELVAVGQRRAIVIQDDVFLGARCIVLKGVTIGAGTVVGAGSVVSRSLPSGVVAAGNPARVIRALRTSSNHS